MTINDFYTSKVNKKSLNRYQYDKAKRTLMPTSSGPSQGNVQQAVSAAAAIAQEPVTHRVEFAITGDKETDMIAGVMAVLNDGFAGDRNPVNGQDFDRVRFRSAQRVCEYLVGRFKQVADEIEHQQQQQERQASRMAAMQGQHIHSSPAIPPGYGAPYYTTSSAGGPLPGASSMLPAMSEPEYREELKRRTQAEMIRRAAERDCEENFKKSLILDEPQGKPLVEVFMLEQAKKDAKGLL